LIGLPAMRWRALVGRRCRDDGLVTAEKQRNAKAIVIAI
jgi:hypothetical protein